ncbi:MAG: GrlR family regulatory protein [Terriglobales bacterium]|jgi:hypothetical protein
MVVDGLWVIEFTGTQIRGSGVVVLINGKLFGGECGFYYVGNYAADGEIVKARVMVRNFDPTIPSGFGVPDDYEMDVSMMLQGDAMTGTAIVTDHPQYSLGIKLTKKAEL